MIWHVRLYSYRGYQRVDNDEARQRFEELWGGPLPAKVGLRHFSGSQADLGRQGASPQFFKTAPGLIIINALIPW